eukprot:CAMPEP_0170461116 /NCGR_PEP_ID=MMETSP0123-20130129/7161_1 /TAXON_ID=182087 /ORGANISM="Favella ehrenbergii, Strain Fehren 1" /LENGTH=174 /DNA_ID=CAMNT_0010726093 /DNA_START=2787 /DNA_END=3309 /DNA_ORIENTATION=+
MHQLMYPEDMQCKCDLGRDWMPSAQGAWTCECKGDYLTQDGRCTTIEEAFPGCAWTYKAGELDEHRVVGLRVGKNVSNGFVDAGVYRCGACQSAMDFFDHEEGSAWLAARGSTGARHATERQISVMCASMGSTCRMMALASIVVLMIASVTIATLGGAMIACLATLSGLVDSVW